MIGGFDRCHSYDSTFGGHTDFFIAYQRVDEIVASWWHEDMSAKGITGGKSSWTAFQQLLRARFLVKSMELEKEVVCSNTIMEEVVPLSGLNLQL